jgi:transcriptional regulator with XRE-family HTH domain
MLGDILREARERAGLSQEQLAFRAGVDRTYVSQLENDKKSPTVQTLFRLCSAMKTSPAAVVARLERRLARPSPSRQTKAPATKRS